MDLSVVIITYNSADTLSKCLDSVKNLAREIVIIDGFSIDNTAKIAEKYNCKLHFTSEKDLGKKRKIGLNLATQPWILALDSDEMLSGELINEIGTLNPTAEGYIIPFSNHYLGRPVRYGGENYKMLRLFKRSAVFIRPALVHEHFEIEGKIGQLDNVIIHHSYRSLYQMYSKFTKYAIREYEAKLNAGERSSLRKVLLNPLHMIHARFIEAQGYRDGIWRLPLDIGFGYMEFLTYLLLMVYKISQRSEKI